MVESREEIERAEWSERQKAEKIREIEQQVMLAFRAGQISREEVAKKLAAVKNGLWEEHRSEYEEESNALKMALAETREAAEVGRVSLADAETRVAEIEAKLSAINEARRDQRKQKYLAVEKQLAELVRAGRIQKVQAMERLAGLEKSLWPDLENEEREAAKMEMRAAKVEMEAMREKLEAALESNLAMSDAKANSVAELKERMNSLQERKMAAERQAFQEHKIAYDAAAAELKLLLKAGEISERQVKARLDALKKRMKSVKEKSGDEKSADTSAELADRLKGIKRRVERSCRIRRNVARGSRQALSGAETGNESSRIERRPKLVLRHSQH